MATTTALATKATISSICKARDAALLTMQQAIEHMQEGVRLAQEAQRYADEAHGAAVFWQEDRSKQEAHKRLFADINPEASFKAFREQVDGRTWVNLMALTGMSHMMDHTEKAKMEKDLLASVPEVTVDNVEATLERLRGDAKIIFARGLATAFSRLDRRFKSHDGFKLGSRIILTGVFDDWGGWSYHRSDLRDALTDVERVFAVIDGEMPNPTGLIKEISESRGRGFNPRQSVTESTYFRIKGFKNGNAHLWFTQDKLVEKANLVLAEYYGAVLPDGVPADVTVTDIKNRSTAICKDLSFYRTPHAVVERILDDIQFDSSSAVLEPSAGDGAIVHEVLRRGAGYVRVVEVDPGRFAQLRALASVDRRVQPFHANFLQTVPTAAYSHVIMNPPFYGTHYMQHVMHAWEFLKPGGMLVSVLPATAETGDSKAHEAFRGWLEERKCGYGHVFQDLPQEAFAESGTRVNTLYVVLRKRG